MTGWTPLLIFFSLGLLMVNFFRFNLLIVIAAVFINIALAQQDGAPLHFLIAAWFLAGAEAIAGIVKLVFGRSRKQKKQRYVG